MIQLRLPNNTADLKNHTHLRAVRANVTRWSSTFEMIDRYVNFRYAVRNIAAVEDLMPRGAAHRRIVALHTKLTELNSVCVKLQYPGRTLAEVRVLFDACLENYPSMGEYLKADASIVHSPGFERAVVKLSNGVPLLAEDRRWLEPFVRSAAPFVVEDEPSDVVAGVLRRVRPRRNRAVLLYDNILLKLPPTSNHCERLFSKCKYVLAPERSSLLDANFKMLMFLKANCAMWNASTFVP
jgi:hypothetical protein